MQRIPLSEALHTYEKMVIRSILTNSSVLWSESNAFSCVMGLTLEQMESCHCNVERWLRLHGVMTMEDHEKAALLLIQSTVRRWLVHQFLKKQYKMYYRLAQLDSLDHCKRALSLERILACAWNQIHS